MALARVGSALSRTAARVAVPKVASASRFMSIEAKVVRYAKYGAPERVLRVETESVSEDLTANQVLVRFMAAPISPVDLSEVSGWVSGSSVPAVGGNEGVAEVISAGTGASSTFKKGDWVVPARAGVGTWRTHAVLNSGDIAPFSFTDVAVEHAATAVTAPCTAVRLLNDFADLKEGDVIVQNNADSSVGQAVVQLAAARGIKTVNIIGKRDDHDDFVNYYHGLGATLVVTEDFARSSEFGKLISDLPAASLGLNSVGGESVGLVARALGEGASLVTFGASGRRAVSLATSAIVSKDLTLRGFSLARWLERASAAERSALVSEATELVGTGKVKTLLAREPFADFEHALDRAQSEGERQVVVVME